MRRFVAPRWIRSLQAQLFLWAVLPLTFALIAVAFTGVSAHQRTMQSFVARRNLALARLMAQSVESGLAHGFLDPAGKDLTTWFSPLLDNPQEQATLVVVDDQGRALFHSDPALVGADLTHAPGVVSARSAGEGVTVVEGTEGPQLAAFAPVRGTGWIVLVEEPVEGLLGPILRLSGLAPVVAGGAGLISLLVFTFGWLTIVRPLRALAQAAAQVSWGSSFSPRPIGGVQEIRDLHQAISEMVARIRGYEAGMRDYLGAMTRGQEAERARLARELHDGPVQALIALGHRAETIGRLLERGDRMQAQALLEELRRAEVETVRELRQLISSLRPAYLDDLGFLPSLENLVQQANERSSTPVRLVIEGEIPPCAAEVELAAYRIAQEALNNALQHARAAHIVVRVRHEQGELVLVIADDGVGFLLPSRPDELTRAGHFGLVGMQERASLAGGTLHIHTSPGAGTEIVARFPSTGTPLPAN